jgi:ribosome maturation factor RimP
MLCSLRNWVLSRKVDPAAGAAFFIIWDKMTDATQLLLLAKPVVGRYDCEIVQLTFAREKPGWVLRLLVEKKDSDPFVGSGIDHGICSGISRELGELLEGDEVIDRHFVLEVSSPGIERPLTCLEDYRRFCGRRVKLRTSDAVDGKKKFIGKLEDVRDDVVFLKTDAGKKMVGIDYNLIARANLVFDINMLEKRSGER